MIERCICVVVVVVEWLLLRRRYSSTNIDRLAWLLCLLFVGGWWVGGELVGLLKERWKEEEVKKSGLALAF